MAFVKGKKKVRKNGKWVWEEYWYNDQDPVSQQFKKSKPNLPPAKPKGGVKDGFFNVFKDNELFDDGYDFGDISRTILGTAKNAAEIFQGTRNKSVENLVDKGATILAKGADLLGFDNAADSLTNYVKRDMTAETDEVLGKVGLEDNILVKGIKGADKLVNKGKDNSIIGSRGEGILGSAGQMVTAATLGAVGLPMPTAMGSFAFGSAAEEALNSGGTLNEALAYGTMTEVIERATERMFDGIKFGNGKTIGEALKKQISKKVGSTTARRLISLGMDTVGEGLEEFTAELGENIASALTFDDEKKAKDIISSEAFDQYIDAAISGAIMGGAFSTPRAIKSAVKGTDYITGRTKEEDTVYKAQVDKRVNKEKKASFIEEETKNRIEKAKKQFDITDEKKKEIRKEVEEEVENGTLKYDEYKVNKKLISKIEDEVIRDFERGEIDTDDISAALSPELYQKIQELKKTEGNEAQIQELTGKMAEELKEKTRGSMLKEIYNQEALKKQKYDYKVKDTDSEITKNLMKSVEDAKVNNTRKSHEIIEFMDKLANKTGVQYYVADSEEVKRLTKRDGKLVNGFARVKDGKAEIYINVDSPSALNVIMGHETTHFLEGTEEYKELAKELKHYAKSRNEYNKLVEEAKGLYREEDINTEVTAQLAGEYLFTDEEFIQKLARDDRNLFQKVYDKIKEAIKYATAGSKQERELMQIKKTYEKALKNAKKNYEKDWTQYDLDDLSWFDDQFFQDITDELNNEERLSKEKKEELEAKKKVIEKVFGVYIEGNKRATYTDERIDYVIKEYGASDKKYAKAFVTSMNPKDFLKLTLSAEVLQKWEENPNSEVFPLNAEELKNETQTPYLRVDTSIGEVEGHEGRHRMLALLKAGVKEVPVVIVDTNTKYSKEPTMEMELSSQDFGHGPVNNDYKTTVKNLIPTNQIYKEQIQEFYGGDSDIKFSLNKPVEEDKNLIAIHNISEDNLIKSLNMGGFPMPSIAITKKDFSHSSYGEISVLFGKDTINPDTNKENKIYNMDAWTPVFPMIEYETSEDVVRRIKTLFAKYEFEMPSEHTDSMKGLALELDEQLKAKRGVKNLIDSLKNDYGMKQFYLVDTGKDFYPINEIEKKIEPSSEWKKEAQFFTDYIGKERLDELENEPKGATFFRHKKEWASKYTDLLKKGYAEYKMKEKNLSKDEAEKEANNLSLFKLTILGTNALAYRENGGIRYEKERDVKGTEKLIDESVNQEEFESWLNDLLKGAVKSTGVWNGKEYLDRNGNRRTFKQLHYLANLEGIVKAMKKAGHLETLFSSMGIWNAAAREYSSIAEMKENANKLQDVPREEISKTKDELFERMTAIAEKLIDKRIENPLIAKDRAFENLVDSVRDARNISDVNNYIKKYTTAKDTLEISKEILQLAKDISNIPTKYFEAKPERAVYNDEIKAVIIPEDANPELIQSLTDNGINYLEYDGTREDRQLKVNQAAEEYDLYFSKFGNSNPEGYTVYSEDVKLKEDPTVQEEVEVTEEAKPEAKVKAEGAEPTEDKEVKLPVNEEPEKGNNKSKAVPAEEFANKEDQPIGELDPITEDELDDFDAYRTREWINSKWYPVDKDGNFVHESDKDALEAINRSIDEQLDADPDLITKEELDRRNKELSNSSLKLLVKNAREKLGLKNKQIKALKAIIQDTAANEDITREDLRDIIEKEFGVIHEKKRNEDIAKVKRDIKDVPINVTEETKNDITDYWAFRQRNFGKLNFNKEGMQEDVAYEILNEIYPEFFPEDIINPSDQLQRIAEVAAYDTIYTEDYYLDDADIDDATDFLWESINSYKEQKARKVAARQAKLEANKKKTHKDIQKDYVDDLKREFEKEGLDLEQALTSAKDLSTRSSIDNTPQRFIEKTLGYKAGQIFNKYVTNRIASNESEAVKWANEKIKEIKAISKQYHIKPGSKESEVAQVYAEGYYVDAYGDLQEFKDEDLEIEVPDEKTRNNIKALAADPRVRAIYDEIFDKINETYVKNGYEPIQKLDNYYLHFEPKNDTFRKNLNTKQKIRKVVNKSGFPFRPEVFKDQLPVELNGMTADLQPGRPWYGSALHREGLRTTHDLIGGLERAVNNSKNVIFHTDDIQRLRGLRTYLAETYGSGGIFDTLNEAEAKSTEEYEEKIEDLIKEHYNTHMSTFAKFLNEEANVLAGKKALVDRGLEGAFGRKAIKFMQTVDSQVGANMVGFNLSSPFTNFISVIQSSAKSNPADVLKAFTQTVTNRLSGIKGQSDGFVENDPFITRREGVDKFANTPWGKVTDLGYVLMGATDSVATEMIVRTKYNELKRKGYSDEEAHKLAGEWSARILGDRSIGMVPQVFNSKLLGIFTKFQLEVRNQLDSMFYDTIQEVKTDAERVEVEKRKEYMARRLATTFTSLAVATHLFGAGFEKVAGYNPTFDIIGLLMTLVGWDDEEEETFEQNSAQATEELIKSLPYVSVFANGGRLPIANAFPNLDDLSKAWQNRKEGKEPQGNDKTLKQIGAEILPYYVMPGGYGQLKKTTRGLKMFDPKLPVSGSYTKSGNLRFPVEKNVKNVAQAAIFGPWAHENAKEYFDRHEMPLKSKEIEEFKNSGMTIEEYWDFREGIKGKTKAKEKADYINNLKLPTKNKNKLMESRNTGAPIDMEDYGNYGSYEEYKFATSNPETYAFSEIYGGYDNLKNIEKSLMNIHSDKKNGKSVYGSRQKKVINYINSLDVNDSVKKIIFKKEYPSNDEYNPDIITYIDESNVPYEDKVTILTELGFTVDNGTVRW